jgi:SRSO17 transposase
MLAVMEGSWAGAVDAQAAWSESFSKLFAQVASAFSNAHVRRRGRSYALGLLSQAERKNSLELAELAGGRRRTGCSGC